jgi:hypothetical protein
MSTIVIQTTSGGVNVNGLAVDPEITIYRADTDAVVDNAAMVDTGVGGFYKHDFFNMVPGLNYYYIVDADQIASGQVDNRIYGGAFDYELTDVWNDRGANPASPKEITENTLGENYTEEADDDIQGPTVEKSVVKVGTLTTITRTP